MHVKKEASTETCMSKKQMITFIKMAIIGIENWSPDMIPVAFERKFDEKFDEIPPGIYRPHIVEIFTKLGMAGLTQKHKNGHKWGRMGSPMARSLHAP